MRRTALIIEDDPLIAFELEDILESLGFAVSGTCMTENEAVDAALQHKPDLLLVDYRLAEGDGVSAVERIAETIEVRVVFVTANADDLRRRRTNPLHVNKPFNREMIDRAVQAAFSGSRESPEPDGDSGAGASGDGHAPAGGASKGLLRNSSGRHSAAIRIPAQTISGPIAGVGEGEHLGASQGA